LNDFSCTICSEPLLDTDPDGHYAIAGGKQPVHVACLIRSTSGSVAHQSRRCSCFGGTDLDLPEGMSVREEAIGAWKYFIEHTTVGVDGD